MPIIGAPAYAGYQVTLTSANTNYNLYDLIAAIDDNAARNARELNIQYSHSGTPGSFVYVGDDGMTGTPPTRYGVALQPGDSKTYRSDQGNVPIQAINLRSGAAGALVNIEIQTF